MLRRQSLLQRSKIFRQQPLHQPVRSAFWRHQSSAPSNASKIDRVTSKLPRRLQRYTQGLRNAPISHIVSFLILHELTAIVPLVALFAFFHYTSYVPVTYVTDHFGSYVNAGVTRFEKYFRRKGWFGFEQNYSENKEDIDNSKSQQDIIKKWETGDAKYKVLVEIALAYAITKALLPIRVIGSVWATPWFARVLLRLRKVILGR